MKMPRFEEQILAYKIYHIIYASRAKLMVSSSFKSIAYKNFKGSNDKNERVVLSSMSIECSHIGFSQPLIVDCT